MKVEANSPDEYIAQLPEERQVAMKQLRELILKNLPEGFEETMSYGMIGYVVPHSIYSPGYHCDPKLPLPFISIASQKSHIGFYHMGIYVNDPLMKWFTAEFPKHSERKLDMGKSCMRFKKPEHIPFELLAELIGKMTVEDWIQLYESELKS